MGNGLNQTIATFTPLFTNVAGSLLGGSPKVGPQDFARQEAEQWKPQSLFNVDTYNALDEDGKKMYRTYTMFGDMLGGQAKETAEMNMKNSKELLALQNEYNERGFLASAPFKLGLAGMQLAGQIATAPGHQVVGPGYLPVRDFEHYKPYVA